MVTCEGMVADKRSLAFVVTGDVFCVRSSMCRSKAGIGAQGVALSRARWQIFMDVCKGNDLLDRLLVVMRWWLLIVDHPCQHLGERHPG